MKRSGKVRDAKVDRLPTPPRGRSRLRPQDSRGIRTRLLRLQELFKFQSQVEFAGEGGVAVSTLKGWMLPRNAKAPDMANLLAFARYLGVSLDWLLVDPMLPEFRGADRPRNELGEALREHVVALLRPEFRRYPGLVGDAVPTGAELLEIAVEGARERVRTAARVRSRAARAARLGAMAAAHMESVQARLRAAGRDDLAAELDLRLIVQAVEAAEAILDEHTEDELKWAARSVDVERADTPAEQKSESALEPGLAGSASAQGSWNSDRPEGGESGALQHPGELDRPSPGSAVTARGAEEGAVDASATANARETANATAPATAGDGGKDCQEEHSESV